MAFTGTIPVDTTTPLGQTRALIGDDQYTDNGDGTGTFGYFSDDTLNVLLSQGYNDPLMAAGFAYLKLAAQAAIVEAAIQGDDLKVNDTSRSARLEAIAQDFFKQANDTEWFSMTPTGDQDVDLRDYLYPTGRKMLTDIFYEAPASVLFPDRN